MVSTILFRIMFFLTICIPFGCNNGVPKDLVKTKKQAIEILGNDSLEVATSQFDSFKVTRSMHITYHQDEVNRKDTTYYHSLFVEMPVCFQLFLSSMDKRFKRTDCNISYETCWIGRDSILDERKLKLVLSHYESTGLYDGPHFVGLTLDFFDEDRVRVLLNEKIADRYRQYFQEILDGLDCRAQNR